MIDHLIKCADETGAHALLDPLGYGSNGVWDTSRVIPSVSIITAEAVWDNAATPPTLVTPEQTLPGYWIAIGLPQGDDARRAALADLDACMLITDRHAAILGQQFIVYMSPEDDPLVIASARVAPVFAGSRYPFGNIP